jgi:hypothetical protein
VCRAEDELRDLGGAFFAGRVDLQFQLDEVALDQVARTGGLLDEL